MATLISRTTLNSSNTTTGTADYTGKRLTLAVEGDVASRVIVEAQDADDASAPWLQIGSHLAISQQGMGQGYPDPPLTIRVRLDDPEKQDSDLTVWVKST